jgi:Peptidase M15
VITVEDYWMGRDTLFADAMTPEILENAKDLLARVNLLLTKFGAHPQVRSGWRPPDLNKRTPNAAPNSRHMTGQAIDLDDPDGDLDTWLISGDGYKVLTECGLWMEHPAATKSWCHLQSVPQRSFATTGLRYYYP